MVSRFGAGGEGRMARVRVVEAALRQAARHERALFACLGEIGDARAPAHDPAAADYLRWARRHANRALGLARVGARLNADPSMAAPLAATVERCERHLMAISARATAQPVGVAR